MTHSIADPSAVDHQGADGARVFGGVRLTCGDGGRVGAAGITKFRIFRGRHRDEFPPNTDCGPSRNCAAGPSDRRICNQSTFLFIRWPYDIREALNHIPPTPFA